MVNTITATEDIWFIVKGEKKHFGKLKTGQTLATINEVDTFQSEEDWKTALQGYGIENNFELPNFELPKDFKFGN